ncbi:MAG: sugar ABC transporter permease [Anaerolineae bacterium]|nr:sugar ABC transporter permease [Anaerolineae bacterium]
MQEINVNRKAFVQRVRKGIWGYVFVSPWVALYIVFGLYPLLLSFFLTFFDYSFVRPENQTFTGIGNWVSALTDPLFWRSVYNIFYNQSIFIFLKNGLGLLIAALIFQVRTGARFFRTIYFMPVVTSVVVLMTIGDYLASPTGPLQTLLVQAGVLGSPVFWKSSNLLPMPVLALINTWKWFGISTVILLAGMYNVSPQLYEAASIDGAGAWQRFRFITLPQLRPQLLFLLTVDLINGLQMFTEVFTTFNIQGGANNQALTPVLYLYREAFDQSNIGYASSLGLVLAIMIAGLTMLQFRIFPSEE